MAPYQCDSDEFPSPVPTPVKYAPVPKVVDDALSVEPCSQPDYPTFTAPAPSYNVPANTDFDSPSDESQSLRPSGVMPQVSTDIMTSQDSQPSEDLDLPQGKMVSGTNKPTLRPKINKRWIINPKFLPVRETPGKE